ncbi:MAG: DUF5054 domain-containing protein [Aquihabitans sp.]
MAPPVRVVHVVAKTHLDLGFTDLAADVVDQYLNDFFPRALAVADELRRRGGSERLVWTTGSWVLHHALEHGPVELRQALIAGLAAGDLAWHALPVTTHTELLDADLFRFGLGFSASLDGRFGRTTTAAKMTDVPGHTRAMVPLLADAGVTFLHLGVNPAWPVPDVPEMFRWRSPDGAEVVVAYQSGGYGGEVIVPGCDEVLVFLHTADNIGPPSVDDVLAAHRDLAVRFPGAEIRASTLSAFADALTASGADLPVVTAEIGDPWLFGAGSDPQKIRRYRSALRARASASLSDEVRQAVDEDLLLVAEHTWGLDEKITLPDPVPWDRASLVELRASAAGRRFEVSWAEQRAYAERAASLLVDEPVLSDPSTGDWNPVGLDTVVDLGGGWHLLVDHLTGEVVTDDGLHHFGRITYQSFDEADYERFYAQLQPTAEDEVWARRDNTKPGIDASGAVSAPWPLTVNGAWTDQRGRLLVQGRFSSVPSDRLGAPARVTTIWSTDGSTLTAEVAWWDKPASRLPEATWVSFVPTVAEPERWLLDKLGQDVSPLDVVQRGGRSLHAVGEGMAYDGPDGQWQIRTLDAPLVAPGKPNLLDADPALPDLTGGFHVLLHDNLWGTNFPMWNEGNAAFRFQITR